MSGAGAPTFAVQIGPQRDFECLEWHGTSANGLGEEGGTPIGCPRRCWRSARLLKVLGQSPPLSSSPSWSRSNQYGPTTLTPVGVGLPMVNTALKP